MSPHIVQRLRTFDGIEIMTVAAGVLVVVAVAFLF
jgi:hypothetical protein